MRSHCTIGLLVLFLGSNAWSAPLSEAAERNLVALARLTGIVRYFHPTDQAASADWNALVPSAIALAEPAGDLPELKTALLGAFHELAPNAAPEP